LLFSVKVTVSLIDRQVVEGGVCKFNVNTDLRGAAVSSMKKAFVEGDNIQTVSIRKQGDQADIAYRIDIL
jgi:fructose/tagatose bisphosphate aldolase